jgi:hypothetical protein
MAGDAARREDLMKRYNDERAAVNIKNRGHNSRAPLGEVVQIRIKSVYRKASAAATRDYA